MPQANSTTSRPRVTSPAASLVTLPCSELISAASSSVWDRTSSRNENITCVRRAREAFRQAAAASAAADDGVVHLGGGGEVHRAGDLAGGGIVDVTRGAARARP